VVERETGDAVASKFVRIKGRTLVVLLSHSAEACNYSQPSKNLFSIFS
jgi:hypothetical protein